MGTIGCICQQISAVLVLTLALLTRVTNILCLLILSSHRWARIQPNATPNYSCTELLGNMQAHLPTWTIVPFLQRVQKRMHEPCTHAHARTHTHTHTHTHTRTHTHTHAHMHTHTHTHAHTHTHSRTHTHTHTNTHTHTHTHARTHTHTS